VYYPWIHWASHWLNEDPWRYCYNSDKLNEQVIMAIEWKETLQLATPQEEATIAVVSSKPTQEKGKRKIAKNPETKKSYKFIEVPLVEKVTLEIEAKRQQRVTRL